MVIGGAGSVGVVLLDSQVGLVVKQPVENVRRIPNGGIDDLGMERGVLIGDVSVEGDAGCPLIGDELGDWAIWSVVEQSAKLGAHDLRRTCAKLCRKMVAIWNRSSFCLGIAPFKRRNDILGRSRTWLLRSTIIWGFDTSVE